MAQARRHAAPLHRAVATIAAAALLPPRPPGTPPLGDVVALVARHHAALLPDLQAAHRSMVAALSAVERVVCGSATGRAPGMAAWYSHWEGAVCGALVAMVHNGAGARQLHGPPRASCVGLVALHEWVQGPPLCSAELVLKPPAVVVVPSVGEMHKQLGRLVQLVLESAR